MTAQARAKLELREHVTAADARDVVDLMKESLFSAAEDEFGCVECLTAVWLRTMLDERLLSLPFQTQIGDRSLNVPRILHVRFTLSYPSFTSLQLVAELQQPRLHSRRHVPDAPDQDLHHSTVQSRQEQGAGGCQICNCNLAVSSRICGREHETWCAPELSDFPSSCLLRS